MNYHKMTTEELRDTFKWTTYGKRGGSIHGKILLKDMTTKHIKNCLKNDNLSTYTKAIFSRELGYRERNGITDKQTRSTRIVEPTDNFIPF